MLAGICSKVIRSAARRPFSSNRRLLQLSRAEAVIEPQTQRAERTSKRFWKTVSLSDVDGLYAIALDGRHVHTPGGKKLLIPRLQRHLAVLVASEWDSQTKLLKPYSLPLTSLVSRAIDAFQEHTTTPNALNSIRTQVIEHLVKFLDTDTIFYHEDFPNVLVELQLAHWKPILDWVSATYEIPLATTKGVLKVTQPDETRAVLAQVIEEMGALELAAFERACMASKSLMIALALVKKAISVEEAALAAHVEVNAQISIWGEVEDSHDIDNRDIRQRLGSAAMVLLES